MPAPLIAWWRDAAIIRRFVSDVVTAQMGMLRPTGFTAPASPFVDSLNLMRDLGVDSLELVAVASALSEALHLHESGVEDRLLARRTIGDWVATCVDGLESYARAITFRTSGSTGAPKRCEHTLADLWQEVLELASYCEGRTRVLSAVGAQHIYGFLFTVLLPQAMRLAGSAVLDVRQHLPSSLPLRLRAGDLVIGYPDFWQGVVRERRALPAGVIGVTSTSACPDDVARDLANVGLDRLVQVYGSSETGGVGVRTQWEAPYTLLSYWKRTDEYADAIVRGGADGRHRALALQDVLVWNGDRHFRPTGRVDGVLQVAGVNVSPARVRGVLVEHPGVHDAAVRMMHGTGTPRLKAFVVPRGAGVNRRSLHSELEAWVSVRLTVPERPRAFSFGAALPADASGKLTDWPVGTTDVCDAV